MYLKAYRRRLRIIETNYGRNSGWIVERQGVPIAILTEPRWVDMFWDSYRMEVVTHDPDLRIALWTKEFWLGPDLEGLIWRNREFGEVAPFAFPAGDPFPEPERLTVRALYLRIPDPWPFEWLLVKLNSWITKRK